MLQIRYFCVQKYLSLSEKLIFQSWQHCKWSIRHEEGCFNCADHETIQIYERHRKISFGVPYLQKIPFAVKKIRIALWSNRIKNVGEKRLWNPSPKAVQFQKGGLCHQLFKGCYYFCDQLIKARQKTHSARSHVVDGTTLFYSVVDSTDGRAISSIQLCTMHEKN